MIFSHYPDPITNEPIISSMVDEDTIACYHAWLDTIFPENFAESKGEDMGWKRLNNSGIFWNLYISWRKPWVAALKYAKKLISEA